MSIKPTLPQARRYHAACTEELARFIAQSPGIRLAQLTTVDGFEIAAQPEDMPAPAKLAAMCSSLQAVSEALVLHSGLRGGRNVMVECDDGYVLVLPIVEVKPALCLLVIANRTAILGHLLWSAKNTISAVARAMGKAA
jgi:predicted regulator of Ras-like GTPase activity (Roadblock/LC7/MglB family)